MGLWPDSARRQAPDVRAEGRMSGGSRGAGCPVLWPDVRAERGRLRLPSVMRGRISGEGADVRGFEWSRMSGAWGRISGLSGSLPELSG